MAREYSSRALKVVTRKRNYKSQARKLSPFGSQFQEIHQWPVVPTRASNSSGSRPADLSIIFRTKGSNHPFRCEERNSLRHARQIQHHHFDPNAESKWTVGAFKVQRYRLLCLSPKFQLRNRCGNEHRTAKGRSHSSNDQWSLAGQYKYPTRGSADSFHSVTFFRVDLSIFPSNCISRLAARYLGTCRVRWCGAYLGVHLIIYLIRAVPNIMGR
jgi:hypothetical protein